LLEDLASKTTAFGGTPAYAAPEVFASKVSRFADQYSLAIVYRELLCGRRPFPDVSSWRQLPQRLHKGPDLSLMPPSDRAAVGRALARDPGGRFLTCGDFVRTLRSGSAGVTDVPSPAETASMTVFIECPRCGQQGKVPKEYQGRSVKCPACREAFTVVPQSARGDTAVAMGNNTPVEVRLPEVIGLAPMEGETADIIDDVKVVVDVHCHRCGTCGTVSETFLGRQVRCPKCARLFLATLGRPPNRSLFRKVLRPRSD
jgi:ssDNA-binding Zn-finger/Zn-ribbon topoisomerase 1